MKTTLALLAGATLLAVPTSSMAGEFGAPQTIEMRLMEIELDSLMDAYGEVFREQQRLRNEAAQLEMAAEDGNRAESEQARRRIGRGLEALERRRNEVREEAQARARQLERFRAEARERGEMNERAEMRERREQRERGEPREMRERIEFQERGPQERRPLPSRDGEPRTTPGAGREIAIADVPEQVMAAARKAAPGVDLNRAERWESPGGPMFRLRGRSEGRSAEVNVSADGHRVEARVEDTGGDVPR